MRYFSSRRRYLIEKLECFRHAVTLRCDIDVVEGVVLDAKLLEEFKCHIDASLGVLNGTRAVVPRPVLTSKCWAAVREWVPIRVRGEVDKTVLECGGSKVCVCTGG